MKHKKFLLIIALFSCCLSVNATSVSTFKTEELGFGFDCVRVRVGGYASLRPEGRALEISDIQKLVGAEAR